MVWVKGKNHEEKMKCKKEAFSKVNGKGFFFLFKILVCVISFRQINIQLLS